MSIREKELEEQLKRCKQSLDKAYDELIRVKKMYRNKPKTGLSEKDVYEINKSINKIHKIEDKLNNRTRLPPIRRGGKKKTKKPKKTKRKNLK